MPRPLRVPIGRFLTLLVTLGTGLGANGPLSAQAPEPGFRKLAPGVVTEIPPQLEEDETFSGPRPLVELIQQSPDLKWEPKTLAQSETLLSMAEAVTLRRVIWGFEFGFKPLRMLDADVRQADGTVRNQRVYYLVYYVKNNGGQLTPPAPDNPAADYTSPRADATLRFFPGFILRAHDLDRQYVDEVRPDVVELVRRREDPNRKLYDSVNISSVTVPVSSDYEDNRVWGVATWTGVDPRSDFLSVWVQGLTNAYRWDDPAGAYQAGDPPLTGRTFTYKTLQLNFWRAGDAVNPTEDEIRFGVPNQNQVPRGKSIDNVLDVYGLKERVDYLWVYR